MPDQSGIDRLKRKLREIFRLDRGDLDFGLYRIMNLKNREVVDFLDNRLLPQVGQALELITKADSAALREELDRAIDQARNIGVDPDEAPGVREIKDRLKSVKEDKQAEVDTYNHLYNFFSRYYSEGDFISNRRYKGEGKEAYAIPYNGEEVKLHWANADQYYIKTTENYSSYTFVLKENSGGGG